MTDQEQARENYDTHVALIAMKEGCGLGTARFLAYEEGKEGLAKRVALLQQGVAQKTLPPQGSK